MTANRRCLILYLKDFLEAHKDKVVTSNQIIQHFDAMGISISRQTIFRSIDTLRDYGMIIDSFQCRNGGYMCVDLEGTNAGNKS